MTTAAGLIFFQANFFSFLQHELIGSIKLIGNLSFQNSFRDGIFNDAHLAGGFDPECLHDDIA